MNIDFRPAKKEDAKQVLRLMDTCSLAEYGLTDNELSDLMHDWQQVDVLQDVRLAFNPKKELIGYAIVMPWGEDLRFDFFIHPQYDVEVLGVLLLDWCEERANQIVATKSLKSKTKIICYVPHINQKLIMLVEAAGFLAVKYIFNMRVDLQQAPASAAWPADITHRTFKPQKDEQEVHSFIQTAFERPGRTPQSFAEWKNAMLRQDIFDAQYWTLAFAGEVLVGACLAFPYEGEGWVRQLGVAFDWRRKGLGAALLQHTFGLFYRQGYVSAGLAVDADNQNAVHFYERVGMRCIRQYDEYRRALLSA